MRSCVYLSLVAALLAAGACAEPARFGAMHVGMPLDEFERAFPDATELEEAKDASGNTVRTMQVPGRDDVEKAYYYVIREHVIGACVVYAKEADYQALVERVRAQNGVPDTRRSAPDGLSTQWRRKGALINLMRTGASKTKLQLPNGKLEVLGPRRVVLLLQNG